MVKLIGTDLHECAHRTELAAVATAACDSLVLGLSIRPGRLGKLTHLDRVTQFFASLNLPAPHMTALAVALIELVGGFLFALGIASRLTALVLFVNMTVAYLSVPDDRVNFSHFLSNPSDFYSASPYTYWFAALLILVFGPGWVAIDTVIGRWFAHKSKA